MNKIVKGLLGIEWVMISYELVMKDTNLKKINLGNNIEEI